jgi:hypothetical protein
VNALYYMNSLSPRVLRDKASHISEKGGRPGYKESMQSDSANILNLNVTTRPGASRSESNWMFV